MPAWNQTTAVSSVGGFRPKATAASAAASTQHDRSQRRQERGARHGERGAARRAHAARPRAGPPIATVVRRSRRRRRRAATRGSTPRRRAGIADRCAERKNRGDGPDRQERREHAVDRAPEVDAPSECRRGRGQGGLPGDVHP